MQTFEDLLSQHPSWSENEMKAASIAWIWRDAELADLRGRMEALAAKLKRLGNDSRNTKIPYKHEGEPTPAGAAYLVIADELLAALDAPLESKEPVEIHKKGQIPVNAPTCERCGKMFLECRCDAPAGKGDSNG